MNGYPPVSHFVGAGISKISGSSFTGMRFAGILFVCATYSLIFEGVRSSDVRKTGLSFCVIVVCLYLLRHAQLTYGSEILGNYFYAQACGHSAALATLFVLSRMQRSWFDAVLVLVLVFLLGWIYALAQVQVLSGALFLWCWAIGERWLSSHRAPFDLIFKAFVLLLLGAVAVRFHPTYELMRAIANNEGGVVHQLFSLPGLAAVACLLAGMSAALLLPGIKRRIDLVHPVFLASAGAAASIAFAVHYGVFLIFQSGSAYGVRKHTFSLVSLLLVIGAVLVVQLICDRLQLRELSVRKYKYLPVIAVSVATAASVWFLLNWGMVDVRGFEDFQRELRLQASRFPEMFGRTVSNLSELSVAQNFAVTMVDLRVPDSLAIKHNLTSIRSSDAIRFEIVDRESSRDQGCFVRKLSTAIVVKANCGR